MSAQFINGSFIHFLSLWERIEVGNGFDSPHPNLLPEGEGISNTPSQY
jgi:hypothetical protein